MKVKEVQVKSGSEWRTAYAYRGWYCIKGSLVGLHTSRNTIRKGTQIWNVCSDDIFTMGNDKRFDTPEYFKEIVDEHIEYIIRAYGSLEEYFKLNS